MSEITNNFEELVNNISRIHEVLQGYASKSVNQFLTLRNWMFGYYIVEYEQNGDDRARYGENLIVNITQKVKHIKGLTGNQLYICRNFYMRYPYFLRTVSVKLQSIDYEENKILQTVSARSQSYDNPPIGIILCSDKNDTLVRYSSTGMDDQLFVSKYLVKLPEKKVFENFLKREIQNLSA